MSKKWWLLATLNAVFSLTVGCKTAEEKCNQARVHTHDAWAAYTKALSKVSPPNYESISRSAYRRIDDECRAKFQISSDPDASMTDDQATGLITCRASGMLKELHAAPMPADASRVLRKVRSPALIFRDEFNAFRDRTADLIGNGPDASEALDAAEDLVEECLSVNP